MGLDIKSMLNSVKLVVAHSGVARVILKSGKARLFRGGSPMVYGGADPTNLHAIHDVLSALLEPCLCVVCWVYFVNPSQALCA